MKKIIKQLGQLIFRHRKKLVYGAFAFLVSQICFFNLGGIGVENEVFAAADADTTSQNEAFQNKASEWYEKLSFFRKSVYVFIYPLLVVAGKLADNSLVYGEVFGFDIVLWQLWNILKNLANFTLGFLVVYKIFKYLIDGKEKIKDILIRGLIAGVGIQASWFAMAALIDVSTILAYGIGGLPINILKENHKGTEYDDLKYNPYMLENVVYLDVKDIDVMHTYFTNTEVTGHKSGEFYISECESFSYKSKDGSKSEELLLAPKMIYYYDTKNGKVEGTMEIACHFGGQVYYFSKLYKPPIEFNSCGNSSLEDCKDKQIAYNDSLKKAITEITSKDEGFVTNLVNGAQILEIGDAHIASGTIGWLGTKLYASDRSDKIGLDLYNKWTGNGGRTSRLQDVLEGNSFVGVFTALYTSLLASTEGVIPKDTGIYPALLNALLSLCHMLAIGIPLIAVAAVLMMRVGVLWVAITLAPFIVLLKAFGLEKAVEDKIKVMKYWKVKNLIPIIFAPAVICFAISISTVLVVIISDLNIESIEPVHREMLGGLIKLDIGGLSIGLGKLIISVLGIAITRFLVWAAIKNTELGKSGIITGMENFAKNALGSLPIIPIPTKDGKGEFIGANAAFGLNGQKGIVSTATDSLLSKFKTEDKQAIEDWIDPEGAAKRANENKSKAFGDKIAAFSPSEISGNWTEMKIEIGESKKGSKELVAFNNLDESVQKSVIDRINQIDNQTLRAALGDSARTIQIGKDTYEFVRTKPKAGGGVENVYKYEKK